MKKYSLVKSENDEMEAYTLDNDTLSWPMYLTAKQEGILMKHVFVHRNYGHNANRCLSTFNALVYGRVQNEVSSKNHIVGWIGTGGIGKSSDLNKIILDAIQLILSNYIDKLHPIIPNSIATTMATDAVAVTESNFRKAVRLLGSSSVNRRPPLARLLLYLGPRMLFSM